MQKKWHFMALLLTFHTAQAQYANSEIQVGYVSQLGGDLKAPYINPDGFDPELALHGEKGIMVGYKHYLNKSLELGAMICTFDGSLYINRHGASGFLPEFSTTQPWRANGFGLQLATTTSRYRLFSLYGQLRCLFVKYESDVISKAFGGPVSSLGFTVGLGLNLNVNKVVTINLLDISGGRHESNSFGGGGMFALFKAGLNFRITKK